MPSVTADLPTPLEAQSYLTPTSPSSTSPIDLAAEYIVIKLQDTDVHVRRAALAALCNKRAAM